MNELIKITDGVAELDGEAIVKIASFEKQIKLIKEAEEELKQRILEEMENKGIIKLESDAMNITYVQPTTRESLDSKTLKTELPDIYNAYCKVTPVKGSIRIKVK